jgi:cytochrome c oxidase assembly protein subunit 15
MAEGLAQDNDPNAHFLVRLRVIHPIIAILFGVYTLNLVRYIYGKFNSRTMRRLSLMLGGLVLAQLTAGVVNLLLLAPVWMQLVHLFLADSVWISFVLLSASTLSTESEQEVP